MLHAVPVEKVVERIQLKEIPVVETEERVVEVVREIPVEIVKEVPVYVKVRFFPCSLHLVLVSFTFTYKGSEECRKNLLMMRIIL